MPAVADMKIGGLSPREWWHKSLTEGILGTTGLTANESIDKYWGDEAYLQVGARVYDRSMLELSLARQREHGADIRPRVKHISFDGEFVGAVHAVEGTNDDGTTFEMEVLAFGRIVNDRIAWLKENAWYPRGERKWAGHPLYEVKGRGLDINGLAPAVWWDRSMTEGIMGRTGLSVDEALDRYWVPDFYCQGGPPVHLSDRATLHHHLKACREDPDAICSWVTHACFDGEYFAALHRVAAGSTSYGDWETENMTFAQIEDGRMAWLKELKWYVRGEATSYAHEFDDFPHLAELNADPQWRY